MKVQDRKNMASKKRYSARDVLEFIWTPGSDSEMSDLEGSEPESEEDIVPAERIKRVKDIDDGSRGSDVESGNDSEEEALIEYVKRSNQMEIDNDSDSESEEEALSKYAKGSNRREEDNDSDSASGEATENEKRTEKKKKNGKRKQPVQPHVYRWRKAEPPQVDKNFYGNDYSLPPENVDQLTPIDYFEMFWKEDLNELISEQTNLYSVQQSGKSINTTPKEIEQLIGVQMQMSIVKLPRYDMYWASETKIPRVSEVMSRNRYKSLRKYLHVRDNSEKDLEENKNDKLFKISPVLDHVRKNCLQIEPEQDNSIDEQIIPAKTKYSGIRQYNPKKPKKMGFQKFCTLRSIRDDV